MNSEQLLILLLAIISIDFVIDFVLDYINLKNQKSTLPEAAAGIYDEEKYARSQDYNRTKTQFGFITSTFSFALMFVVFSFGILGWLYGEVSTYFTNEVFAGLAFFGILFIASDIINIPFQLYSTFGIEEKFEFNKTTPKTFIVDKIKGYVLTALIGGVILGLLLLLIQELGEWFWVYFWIVITAFLLIVKMFYASLILPLFNKLTPLEDGPLKEKIQAYCDEVAFPLTNVYVIDGSKRSTKANAFFSGIGKKKKIVLYDTLINNHTDEELVAVLAHEVGHYKKKHIIGSYIISIAQVGIMLFILSLLVKSEALSQALGYDSVSVPLNLLAFAVLYTPISKITGIFMNMLSRKNEFEADAYAGTTYKAAELKNALRKLSVNNLSNLTPHKTYVFVHYSHPPLLKRLSALEQYE